MKEINWHKVSAVILIWEAVTAIAASVMVGGILTIMGDKLPPQIPLFYSLPWGEEQLASPGEMGWALASVWIVFLLGWTVSKSRKEPVLCAFVTGAGLVSQIVIVLGLVRIILITI